MTDLSREVCLTIPADPAYTPVATLALSGFGMMVGLDVDMLGDLRTVAAECLDCLRHQSGNPQCIEVCASVKDGMLRICFSAKDCRPASKGDELDLDITRGVLETLMPKVCLEADENGVHGILCAMPV